KILTLLPFSHLLRFVVTPLLISFIIQSLIKHPHDYVLPLWLIGATAACMTISTIANNKGYTILFRLDEAIQTRLLKRGLNNLMNQSYQFFAEQKVGTLAGDLVNFSRSYIAISDTYFLNTNHLLISFVCGLVVIGALAPILLLPTVAITVILVVLNIKNVRARAPFRDKRKKLTSELAGSIADILGNQLLVRIFATESRESERVSRDRHSIEGLMYKEIDIIERESLHRQAALYGFQLCTLLLFVWMSANNLASIAAVIFTFTYLNRSTDAIFSISALIRQYEQAFLDATPMMRILQQPQTVIDKSGAAELAVTKGAIKFKNVTFAYSDQSDDPVFTELNLEIPFGQRVGLAGHSGGGKTTLTKLLLRFVDIDGGEILIDGQNIAEVTQQSLRSQIAYVPQDPFLFHRSLRENIAYGKAGATDEEIITAAKKAHAWEFIQKLSNGLDTIVGERGVKLSGGQRQRIAIARAILKDAPILILDEATSALDSESEKLIQQSLTTLMKGRTSIVIAHRLSTIAKLDRIIVLDDGKVIEDGTHEALLEQNKTYAKLWNHQSGGFIEE
ncbi:ABC transporter ATP-binding protein, partial [Patescibacteria group bacterium]